MSSFNLPAINWPLLLRAMGAHPPARRPFDGWPTHRCPHCGGDIEHTEEHVAVTATRHLEALAGRFLGRSGFTLGQLVARFRSRLPCALASVLAVLSAHRNRVVHDGRQLEDRAAFVARYEQARLALQQLLSGLPLQSR